MSTKISHGFDVRSATPIDSRITIKSMADMREVDDDIMPESYIAVCTEDGALYTYLKSRFPDPVTGKFRLVQGAPIIRPIIYGMHVDGTKSNPAEAVTYLEGCDNADFTPAGMNFTTDTFSYGSWENAFFIPRPCMLKYDGTVAYYLNPNDYAKKIDGSASDVANASFDGNAMMEWGKGNNIRIWYKVVPSPSNPQIADIYVSNQCAGPGYHAWSFYDADNNLKDHFYTAIYNGSLVNNRLRSLSGATILNSKSASDEITYVQANGDGWYTDVYCDRVLINILLMLMSKHLAPKEVFGWGNRNGGTSAAGFNVPGSMNTNGLFWGKKASSTSDKSGVKVFGMENWWGNIWRRTAGLINAGGRIKYKMCLGTEDGSSVTTYNLDGSGYLTTDRVPGGSSGSYISVANYTGIGAWTPITASGSETTFYEDGLWFNNSQTDYALFGGTCGDGAPVGPWYVALNIAASGVNWDFGASLSFR